MIEGILEVLVNIGLISTDWYHDRKIKKQEKKAVKRIGTEESNLPVIYSPEKKSNFKRYLFRPSMIVYGIILGSVLAFVFITTFYKNAVSKPSETKTELELILRSAENWKVRNGVFPVSIKPLTNVRPHRNTWMKDEWGMEYKVISNTDKFEVISAGPDKQHGTYDDISLQIVSQP